MKNILRKTIALLICGCILFALASCNTYPVDFNKLLESDYETLKLEVKTEQEMGTLINIYDISETENGTLVKYSCQSFAQLDISAPTDDRIKNAIGEVLYNNGEEISQSGERVLYDLPKSVVPGLDLSTKNMKNIKDISDGKMKADIVNISVLLGRSTSAEDAEIVIEYTDTAITSIIITYTKSSANVTLKFTLG